MSSQFLSAFSDSSSFTAEKSSQSWSTKKSATWSCTNGVSFAWTVNESSIFHASATFAPSKKVTMGSTSTHCTMWSRLSSATNLPSRYSRAPRGTKSCSSACSFETSWACSQLRVNYKSMIFQPESEKQKQCEKSCITWYELSDMRNEVRLIKQYTYTKKQSCSKQSLKYRFSDWQTDLITIDHIH